MTIIFLVLAFIFIATVLYIVLTFDDGNVESSTQTSVKRSLNAQVIRACPNCGAPGVDENNKYVGETCPKCGNTRPPLEELGEIWSRSI